MDCFIEKGEKLNKGKYHGKATRISFVFNECPIEECYAKESFKSMPLIPFNAIARHGMNIENSHCETNEIDLHRSYPRIDLVKSSSSRRHCFF